MIHFKSVPHINGFASISSLCTCCAVAVADSVTRNHMFDKHNVERDNDVVRQRRSRNLSPSCNNKNKNTLTYHISKHHALSFRELQGTMVESSWNTTCSSMSDSSASSRLASCCADSSASAHNNHHRPTLPTRDGTLLVHWSFFLARGGLHDDLATVVTPM